MFEVLYQNLISGRLQEALGDPGRPWENPGRSLGGGWRLWEAHGSSRRVSWRVEEALAGPGRLQEDLLEEALGSRRKTSILVRRC